MSTTIFYGTVTGNSEAVAEDIKKAFEANGLKAKTVNMTDASVAEVASTDKAIFVTSTWGDGEPPMDAQDFYDELKDCSEDFSNVSFAVFGLGESIYEMFCQTAIDIDEFMQKNGAKKLLEVEKADGEAEPYFAEWIEKALKAFA